jgi:hypothetical protein
MNQGDSIDALNVIVIPPMPLMHVLTDIYGKGLNIRLYEGER